jgi:1,4-alpha-glucan branching enzyme
MTEWDGAPGTREGRERRALRVLARLYGAETRHLDGLEREIRPSAEALAAVLAALGAPLTGVVDAPRALRERNAELASRLVEPVSVVGTNADDGRIRRGPGLPVGERVALRVSTEDGETHEGAADVGPRGIAVPFRLPEGYHRAEIFWSGRRASNSLLVAPERVHGAPAEVEEEGAALPREWGVFLPLHALRSARDRGVGDLTDLERLLDWVEERGGGAVGTLPLLAGFMSEPHEPSPYSPVSRLFWNELYLDPERVPEWETVPEARELAASPGFRARVERLRRAELVDYREAYALQCEILDRLAAGWHEGGGGRSEELRRWLKSHPDAPGYASFRAVMEARGVTWERWPRDWRHDGIPPSAFEMKAYRRHLYAQLRMEQQLEDVVARDRDRAGVYLDLPLGAHSSGYDTWANPGLFAPGAGMGAPPDEFHREGQAWGLVPMRPEAARSGGHRHFRSVLRRMLPHAKYLRIDHVMALHRLYWVPDAMDAADGVYVRQPHDELYAVLCIESRRHAAVIVGEDLGTVPMEVRSEMDRRGVRRMHVVPFELDPEAPEGMNPVPPGAVASLNTHDMPTFIGAWSDPKLREGLRRAAEGSGEGVTRPRVFGFSDRGEGPEGEHPEALHVMGALLQELGRSPAGLVVVNLEDLWLEERPQNVPGGRDPRSWRGRARLSFEEFVADFRVGEFLEVVRAARLGAEPSVTSGEEWTAWLPEGPPQEPAGPPEVAEGRPPDTEQRPAEAEEPPETAEGRPEGMEEGQGADEEPDGTEEVHGVDEETFEGTEEVREAEEGTPEGTEEPPAPGSLEAQEASETMDRTEREREGAVRAPLSLLTDDDIHLFNEGTHNRLYRKLGAHLSEDPDEPGVHFGVWAPSAERVSVVGDFNGWDPEAHPLEPRAGSGIWEGFLPDAGKGAVYKYDIRSRHGGYRVQKADPFGFRHEVPPATASVVWDLEYEWGDGEWMTERGERNAPDAPVSVYEVHLGSWRRDPERPQRLRGYREIAPELAAHVKECGFTHVEFLPLMEHPFFGSWGYQTTGYFAPTSRHGSPQDLMFLIDHLHREGIGVFLDWVPSHFPSDEHGLGYFDGTHLFEHRDPRQGFHPDWESLIFNFGRDEVRSFLLSSALFWLDHYHVDGLRVDAVASMLYLDYSRREGEWIPNRYGGRENLEAIDFLRRLNEDVYGNYPDVQTIAEESTAWPMVSRPTYVGGLGFGMKWDMGWMHDSLRYLSRDPIHRRHHHHELSFRGIYQFNENFMLPLSHDEVVHGKGSLLSRMPGDHWQKKANLRLLLAYQFLQPGKKLLFMGGELGQWTEWNHDGDLDWALLEHPDHAGIRRLVADLNRCYREENALHQGDFLPEGFEWIDTDDAEHSVLSFLRKETGPGPGGPPVAAVFNLTPVPRENYRLGVPSGGRWTEILNTDAEAYGGSGMGNLGGVDADPAGSHGRFHSLVLSLPPLAAVVLKGAE